MERTTVTRRRFLAAGAGGLLGVATFGATASGIPPVGAAIAFETGPSDGVTRLGRAYLRDRPREAKAARLLRLLPEINPAAPARSQLAELARRVEADFTEGAIVRVRGWVLSRSEARGAALVSLGG